MPKSRAKTRENAWKGKREERLDRKNAFGNNDPTPFEAVIRIREGEKNNYAKE